VLSTITGVDKVVIVTEPGLSGLHDLERCLEICEKQGLRVSVVINKYDINPEQCLNTELFCSMKGVEIAGKVPFDKAIVMAMVNCKSIIEWSPDSAAAKEITRIFTNLIHEG
jgi:MinD superfamily P-loop ATPase